MKTRKLRQPGGGKPKPALTRLKELPMEDRVKLMEVLRTHTYEQAGPLASKQLGFACSSSALSKFFQWQATQESLEAANDFVAQYEEFSRKQNPDWSPDRVRDNAIAFFMLQTAGQKDREGFVQIASLDLAERSARNKARLEERKISISERRVQLLEKKAAQADAAKGVMESKELSEEQRAARMREIFGIA